MKTEIPFCPECDAFCKLTFHHNEGKNSQITGCDSASLPCHCLKGYYGSHRSEGWANPYSSPMMRTERDGPLRPVSWDVAIRFAASKLMAIRENYGSDSLMFTAPQHPVNIESSYLIQRYARSIINTNNIDYSFRPSDVHSLEGILSTLGIGTLTNPLAEVINADLVLVFGFSYAESHSLYASHIIKAKENGAKIFICDWRTRPENALADIFLQVKQEGVIALLNGLNHALKALHVSSDSETESESYDCISECALPGFGSKSPESTEIRSGVSAQLVRLLARQLATSDSLVLLWEPSFILPAYDAALVRAMVDLSSLTKSPGCVSGVVGPVNMPAGISGAVLSGALPDMFPGYQPVSQNHHRRKFAEKWGADLKSLSTRQGKRLSDLPDLVRNGEVKGCYLIGQQPWNEQETARQFTEALSSLDFLIVQDTSLTEQILKMADVFLPSLVWHQQEGMHFRGDGELVFHQPHNVSVNTGQAKSDWEIIAMMTLMSGDNTDWNGVEDIWEEMRALCPSLERLTTDNNVHSCGY